MNEETVNAPWWLEPGYETCPFCSVRYQVEAAYYCVDCDRAACPACFTEIHVTRRVYCPECAPRTEEPPRRKVHR